MRRRKKAIVVGAGVIGTTTAWYLTKSGYDVVVLEKNPPDVLGASQANGGQLSWSHALPMAAPGMAKFALANFWRKSSPVNISPGACLKWPRWMIDTLKECTPERYRDNARKMSNLARWSLEALDELSTETNLDFEKRSQGMVQVFRSKEKLDTYPPALETFRKVGLKVELAVGRDEIASLDPALSHTREPLAGALRFSGQSSGDCRKFVLGLREAGSLAGVQFIFGAEVTRPVIKNGNVVALSGTDSETWTADLYVFCTGLDSAAVLRSLLKIPLCPVKGYSMTVAPHSGSADPSTSIIDEDTKLSIARFDHCIRVAAFADLVGFDTRLVESRLTEMEKSYSNLFPGTIQSGSILDHWSGFRPMTPDGVPVISDTAYRNLYLNLGHGAYGWTMSCGSARLICEIVQGSAPTLPTADYSLNRQNLKWIKSNAKYQN